MQEEGTPPLSGVKLPFLERAATNSGGSEALAAESWDVSEFAGKTAELRVVDDAKGDDLTLAAEAKRGEVKFEPPQVHELKSAWTSRWN